MLQVGDSVPAFTVKDHLGNEVSAASLLGHNTLIYFYPKADTPGCTTQGCAIRDGWDDVEDAELDVYGASFDSAEENAIFAKKYNFPFPLLCDTDKVLAKALGVDTSGPVPPRVSFIIDQKGVVRFVYDKVDVKEHLAMVLKDANTLPKHDLKGALTDMAQKIETMRDRAKLKLHLASMESKTAFGKLDPVLSKISADMNKAAKEIEASAEGAEVQGHLAFMEARQRWDELKDYVGDVVGDITGTVSKDAKSAADEAKLQAHLAAMDAEDAVKKRKEAAKDKWNRAARTVKRETREGLSAVRGAIDSLLSKLD